MPKNILNPEQPDWASVKIWAQDVADRAMVLHWQGLSPQYQLDSLAESYRKLAAELKKMEAAHDAA